MTHTNFVVVAGATGATGVAVVNSLVAANIPVRALVRDPAKAAKILPQSDLVELYQIDSLGNLEAVVKAYTGARGAYVLSALLSEAIRVESTQAQAALLTNLPLVVYLSTSFIAYEHGRNILGEVHEHSEKTFQLYGVPTVNLRPECFFSNHLRAGHELQAGYLSNVTFDQRLPSIDVRDIGDVTAKIFEEGPKKHAGETYYLTTEEDQALTAAEQTEIISKAIGKPLKVVNQTPQEWEQGKEAFLSPFDLHGLSSSLSNQRENYYAYTDVRKVLGRKPRSFEQFVNDHIAFFKQ